jgi:hypothetical protein
MQTDKDKIHYSCLHPVWPPNRIGDFCPIVECGGKISKCEILPRFITQTISGKKRRLTNLRTKALETESEISKLQALLQKEAAL